MPIPFLSQWFSAAPASPCIESDTLMHLCSRFMHDFTKWVDSFPSSASYAHEVPVELDSLEQSWSLSLSQIELRQPKNQSEATAKYEVAQAYAAWSSPEEGRASALIAAASAGLFKFSASGPGSIRQPSSRGQIRGPRSQEHTIKVPGTTQTQ